MESSVIEFLSNQPQLFPAAASFLLLWYGIKTVLPNLVESMNKALADQREADRAERRDDRSDVRRNIDLLVQAQTSTSEKLEKLTRHIHQLVDIVARKEGYTGWGEKD